jgi:hypothetical protein
MVFLRHGWVSQWLAQGGVVKEVSSLAEVTDGEGLAL